MCGGGGGWGEWSWEENKVFEEALAVVDLKDPRRWEAVASMVKGRSPEEVERHYAKLLEDVRCIESGKLDHGAGEVHVHVLAALQKLRL